MSISTYDGDESHLLDWGEFIAFLSGRRSPYVTLSLYPKTEALAKVIDRGGEAPQQQQEGEEEEEQGQQHYSPPDFEGGAHPK